MEKTGEVETNEGFKGWDLQNMVLREDLLLMIQKSGICQLRLLSLSLDLRRFFFYIPCVFFVGISS